MSDTRRMICKWVFAMTLFLVPMIARSQGTPAATAWTREDKSDPLHNLQYTQFTLEGRYLIGPRGPRAAPPMLVVNCKAGDHRYSRGRLHGKLLEGYLAVDAVLDFRDGRVPVEYRLDKRKLQNVFWTSSTDGSGAFFSDVELDNLLYGHWLPHRENTNPPVHKVLIGVPEYLGSEIEVEFDMPSPSDVADVCGVAVYPK